MIVLISPKALRLTLTSLFLATAAGAALTAPPPDGGLTDLQASVQGLIIGTQPGTVVLPLPTLDTAEEVRALLQKPLSADAAVRIAVLNNPDLQIAMGAAGMSISDAVRSDNPAKLKMRQAITVLSARAYKAWVSAVAATVAGRGQKYAGDHHRPDTAHDAGRQCQQADPGPCAAGLVGVRGGFSPITQQCAGRS